MLFAMVFTVLLGGIAVAQTPPKEVINKANQLKRQGWKVEEIEHTFE